MNIGAMNVRIIIQINEVTVDRYGNHTSKWTDYFECWATASGQTGRETSEKATTEESDQMNFTVRYCSETARVTSTKYRILLGDRFYNIVHVDVMNFRHNSLKFMAVLVRR